MDSALTGMSLGLTGGRNGEARGIEGFQVCYQENEAGGLFGRGVVTVVRRDNGARERVENVAVV